MSPATPGAAPIRPALLDALRSPSSPELEWLDGDALVCRPLADRDLQALTDQVELAERRPRPDLPEGGPNSMHAYGATFEQLGLVHLGRRWLEQLLQPLGELHFGLSALDTLHAFAVHYAGDADLDLDLHVDQSDLTLNLCLDGWFEGGDLELSGARCMDHLDLVAQPPELHRIQHAPGQAVVHRGSVRHSVRPLEAGRRRGLILWARCGAHWDAGLPLGGCGPARCANARL